MTPKVHSTGVKYHWILWKIFLKGVWISLWSFAVDLVLYHKQGRKQEDREQGIWRHMAYARQGLTTQKWKQAQFKAYQAGLEKEEMPHFFTTT